MNKNFAKVRLSAEEMRLVKDPAWILTKNSVMGKVVEMMAGLSEEWRAVWGHANAGTETMPAVGHTGAERKPAVLPPTEPKISKGENYKGLPWVMLDYPRVFGREEVCAIRTMFWWGHAFSITLHLKGEYMRMFLPAIRRRYAGLAAAGFGVSISEDEWAHEHTKETYGPLNEGTADSGSDSSVAGLAGVAAGERAWFKLSARVELGHWDEAPERLSRLYHMLLDVLSGEDTR